MKLAKSKRWIKALSIVYMGITLVALLFGSGGCKFITFFSQEYKDYAFQQRSFSYRVESIESAYLSRERDLLVCFSGWLPGAGARNEQRRKGQYTIRIPVRVVTNAANEVVIATSTVERRRVGNALVLAPETVTEGWVTDETLSAENPRRIPVVNAWDAKKGTSSTVARDYGNPPRVWKGAEATVYDAGNVPRHLCPHDLRLMYVQKRVGTASRSYSLMPVPGYVHGPEEGVAFATFSYDSEGGYLRPTHKTLYPLTAPLVLAVDIVSLPVKAGAVVCVVVYLFCNPDEFRLF